MTTISTSNRIPPTRAAPDRNTTADACGSVREQLVGVWARALFCSALRPGDLPGAAAVCQAVVDQLAFGATVAGGLAGMIAQEAGDYPENFEERMAWCRRAADSAYTSLLTAHALHQSVAAGGRAEQGH